MSQEQKNPADLLKEPLHGIYIPIALVLGGTLVFGYQYVPIVLAILLPFLAFRLYSAYVNRQSIFVDKWTALELADSTIISKNSAIYRFNLSRNTETLDIPVGFHLACKVNDEVRYYTPISSKTDQGYFEIIVKSYSDGNVSKFFAGLRPGQTVQFKGPVGRFNYTTNHVKEIGMIAGGSGITPMLQVLSEITTTPEDVTKVSLIFANETENDILLKDELDELAEKYPYFNVHYTLTTPPENWSGDVGYVTKDMIQRYLPAPSDDSRILICGPMGMKKAMIEHTTSLGFKDAKMPSKGDDQVFVF
jgi:cytochrome-b5 reductase